MLWNPQTILVILWLFPICPLVLLKPSFWMLALYDMRYDILSFQWTCSNVRELGNYPGSLGKGDVQVYSQLICFLPTFSSLQQEKSPGEYCICGTCAWSHIPTMFKVYSLVLMVPRVRLFPCLIIITIRTFLLILNLGFPSVKLLPSTSLSAGAIENTLTHYCPWKPFKYLRSIILSPLSFLNTLTYIELYSDFKLY